MIEWHVYGPGDTLPTVYEDPSVLQLALASYASTDVVMVYTFKRMQAGAVIYNGPGGNPLPPMPNPAPVAVSQNITHWKKG